MMWLFKGRASVDLINRMEAERKLREQLVAEKTEALRASLEAALQNLKRQPEQVSVTEKVVRPPKWRGVSDG